MANICNKNAKIQYIIWLRTRISIQKRTLVKSQLQHRNRKVVLKQDKWIQCQNLRSLRDRWNWSNAHHVSVRELIGEYSELDMVTNPPAGWDLQRRRTEMSEYVWLLLWNPMNPSWFVFSKKFKPRLTPELTPVAQSCTGLTCKHARSPRGQGPATSLSNSMALLSKSSASGHEMWTNFTP